VESVRIHNVPSYLAAEGVRIDCPGLGELVFDVAYGGNCYAIIEPQKNYGGLETMSADAILRLSADRAAAGGAGGRGRASARPDDQGRQPRAVDRQAARSQGARPQRRVLTATARSIARPAAPAPRRASRSLRPRASSRSATTSVHESIIGKGLFEGRVESATALGNHTAIVPSIAGWARQHGLKHHLRRRARSFPPRLPGDPEP